MINGGTKKNMPVSLEPRERPMVKDRSIMYLVFSIKYFGNGNLNGLSRSLIDKYIDVKKKKVRNDSVVPKWADWMRPGVKGAQRAAIKPK
jgi:hypothetical protein